MRLGEDRPAGAPVAAPAAPRTSARTIPYDYSFRFRLDGSGNTVKETVTVSVEGVFRAVAIGFGFVPDVGSFRFGVPRLPEPEPPVLEFEGAPAVRTGGTLGEVTVAQVLRGAVEALPNAGPGPRRALLETVLERPIRLNPRVATEALLNPGAPLSEAVLDELFEVVGAPGDIEVQFLYGLYDDGTGREFQSEPILSTAGLGISNGDRPFRTFPVPIDFAPRSVIRMEVTPVGAPPRGDLYVALHGYKELAPPRIRAASATGSRSARRRRSR